MQDYINRLDNDTRGWRFYEGVIKKLTKKADGKVEEVEERQWCYPSVTTKIGEVYPTSFYLTKWIRDHGEYGQATFEKAGDEGTDVHIAIEDLLNGAEVSTLLMEDKVKRCLLAFVDWYNEFKPEILETEHIMVNHELKYAGTKDLRARIDYQKGKTHYKGVYTIDYKTSKSVHDSQRVTTAGYIEDENDKGAILHLGNQTKAGWSFLEFDVDKYRKQFIHFNNTFEMLYPNSDYRKLECPQVLTLKLNNNEKSIDSTD